MKSITKYESISLALIIFLANNPAFADSLDRVARTLSEKTIGVAQTLSLFGIGVGAIMLFIPWTRHLANHVLQGAGLGALLSFGAPIMIQFLKSLFT